ncbi:MAG: glutaminyl-peptide cyclotransferase [Gemmatimonas sp.]|nr:glutaminyl-peptide cyclotransferase [Gemmatimonas sp.]
MLSTSLDRKGWRVTPLAFLRTPLILAILLSGCAPGTPEPLQGDRLEVMQTLQHDLGAYTQGLIVRDGYFWESTGLNGASSLRRIDATSGEILERRELPERFFGEGLAALEGRLYQLTWRHGIGFIYGAKALDSIGTFAYSGEGWGLTTDGSQLIMSDGTYRLRFLHPETFEVTRVLEVSDRGRAVFALNELEWVDGEIWANIWQQDNIARIDPSTGEVVGWLNVGGFISWWDRVRGAEVANGIAYDSVSGRLWVTGKNWPRIYEVRLPS